MNEKIDVLSRKEFVDNLVQLVRSLADNGRGCTFAIDGVWGCGKTYVLDMFEKEIGFFQHPDAAGDRYILFHYNCWQYDYYDEPAIAIIAAIRDVAGEYNRVLPKVNNKAKAVLEVAKDLGKDFACNFIETKLGVSPEAIIKKYDEEKKGVDSREEKEHDFDTFFSFKTALNKTRSQLAEMSRDKPIIVVVDELDRCVPEYAIKVLERLHHLFDNQSNIVVVLAYDMSKLSCAIQRIYGIDEQDISHFMKKFVSFSLPLDRGTISDTFWERHNNYLSLFKYKNEDLASLFTFTQWLFQDVDVRTQEKVIERSIMLHTLAFGKLSHISILYFELLHQTLAYKCGDTDMISSIISSVGHAKVIALSNALGEKKYKEFEEMKESIYDSSVVIAGRGSYSQIKNTPLAICFWCFEAMHHDIDGHICGRYSFDDAQEYTEIVAATKVFDRLAKTLK